MDRWLIAVILFCASGIVSALLVWRSIPIYRRLGLLDPTGPRKVHTNPVPRGAGVAMFIAFAVGLALSFALDVQRFPVETERLLLLVTGAAVIVLVMLVDDAIGLPPMTKLGWQIGAAAIVVLPRLRGPDHGIVIEQFNAPVVGEVSVPLVLAIALTLFWIVGMMNTLNWVDGLDGLAGSVTFVACSILFLHTYFWPRDDPQFTVSLVPLVLGATVLGFLIFNWHPAKIIMGDSGANFLGYTLAIASIIGGAKIATALLALGLPVLDVAWVIVYRIAHGKSPLEADRGHLHHRLLDGGWSQGRIVLFVAGISAVAGLLSLLLPTRTSKLAAIVVLGIVLLSTVWILATRDGASLPQEADEAASESTVTT